jgi:hypothetical protein
LSFVPFVILLRSGLALACLHWWLFIGDIPARVAQGGAVPLRINVWITCGSQTAPSSSSSSSSQQHAAAIRTACATFLAIFQVCSSRGALNAAAAATAAAHLQ